MYKDMSKIFQDVSIGNYRLENFEITPNNRPWRCDIPDGRYVRLLQGGGFGGQCVMSNTPMEERTNRAFVTKAHGDILIGGLGIGMVLLAIQDKLNVRSITVIEKSPEVMQMVLPQLPLNNKIKVINASIFEWVPPKGVKYDCIYFDIWNYINSDVYQEMKALKLRFKNKLVSKEINPDRFMSCWAEMEAKHNIQLR